MQNLQGSIGRADGSECPADGRDAPRNSKAQMAELVDALDSKSGYRKVVQVRFLFWALRNPVKNLFTGFYISTSAIFFDTFSRFVPFILTHI